MEKIIKFIIIGVLLVEARLFYIFKLPDIVEKYNNYNNKMIIFAIILFGMLFIILTNNLKKLRKYLFGKYVIFFVFLTLIQICYSLYHYDQTAKALFASSYYFFIIIFYYILAYFLDSQQESEKIVNNIIIVSMGLSIIFLIQGIYYQTSGKLFLNIPEVNDTISGIFIRNNRIRLTQPSTLISFSIILSFGKLFSDSTKRWKVINIFNVIVGILYIYYVCQTRVLLIAIFIPIILMIIFRTEISTRKKYLILFLTLVILILAMRSSIVTEFLDSFNSYDNSGSVYARQEAIQYYFGKIIENPFNGMGIIFDDPGSDLYFILHGLQGYLFTTDVGIIGFWCIMGTFGAVWYIMLIFKIAKMTFVLDTNKRMRASVENLGMLMFLLSTSFTLIVTDPQRIILLPLIMFVVEFNYRKLEKDINKDFS